MEFIELNSVCLHFLYNKEDNQQQTKASTVPEKQKQVRKSLCNVL